MAEDTPSEERFQRQNRVLRAIRTITQLLTREKDPRRLIRLSCHHLMETLGYCNAWIALLDAKGQVASSTACGSEENFPRIQERLERGEFPPCMEQALQADGIIVFENPRDTCRDCSFANAYPGTGRFSTRLHHGGRNYGVLTVSVPSGLLHDPREQELFVELAGDLGFALHRIEDEERLRLHAMILSEIRDMVTLTDITGRIVYVNSAENVTLKRTPDQLLGQMVEIYGDDPETGITQREIVKKALAEGQWRGEMINTAADGTKVYLDCNIWAIRNEAGEPKYLCGVSRDITDTKKAERALRESHQLLDSIFRAAPVGIGLVRQRVLIEVNETLCRITGYPRDELIGHNSRILYASDEEYEYVGREKYHQIAERGTGTVETQWLRKDGSTIHVLLSSTPLDNQDMDKGVTFTALDISERKRIEEALRESERQLSTLMKNLPGMVYRCHNDPQWTMEFVSEGCRSLTGYAPEEIIKNSVVSYASLIHPEDREIVWENVQKGVREGTPFLSTYRIVHRSGATKWVWEQGCGIFNGEKLVALEGFITDITEQKLAEEEHRRLEQQIQQTQKLESLGVLAGGIAHDFNNILMAVLGHADLALDELSPMSPARERIRDIETAARRAAELCRQMLAYSGKASFAHELINLRELIEEMVHLLKSSISKKALLNLHLSGDLPPILGDPNQIRQIVMNLIINASDALGDRDGVITISAGAIQCDADYLRSTYLDNDLSPGLYAYLDVMDTGCGMDEKTLGRIFEPFFTTKFTGRGLGLAAVLGIVRAHKGAIRVYSEPNKGTNFKVLFPAEEVETTEFPIKPQTDPRQWKGQGTILFVDDEPILRTLGTRMLKQIGFNVLVASDGREAVDLYTLRGQEIDLVLMDLTMPHMDGAEAFDALRRLNPGIKVILASGFSGEDVSARFAGKGIAGVLQKPYRFSTLRQILARVTSESIGPPDTQGQEKSFQEKSR